MQSNESLGVLRLIFPLARAGRRPVIESTWVGHGPCHTFIESCPQGVLRTVRVVIQPESSGCGIGHTPPEQFSLPWEKTEHTPYKYAQSLSLSDIIYIH